MPVFSKNDIIELEYGGSAKIIGDKPLGSGGQGEVYRVQYDNKQYALKWYTADKIRKNISEFKKNIDSNISDGPPSSSFLWPKYITKVKNGSFGYLMDLMPSNLESFSSILLTYRIDKSNPKKPVKVPVRFSSLDTIVLSALHIVKAFRELHRQGKSYQDMNDGGFFFDTKTGDVLVCDCDNIAPDRKNFGIGGKPGYMAPEIVTRTGRPNVDSDKFSLAVILFRLFMRGDPLEGKKVLESCSLTGEAELKHYGTEPVFVFDPNDASNRPVRGVHENVIRMWDVYPDYIKNAFIQTFTEGMHNPSKRVIDNEWFKLLVRMRSEIVSCSCGRPAIFASPYLKGSKYVCSRCKSEYPTLRIGNNLIVLNEGTKLYSIQIDKDSEDFETVAGKVSENKKQPGLFGLKNLENKTWSVTYPDGTDKNISTNGGAPLVVGMKIDFGKGIIGQIE